MFEIKPIKLLAGSHAETAQTGQGCFMNVIAYLNGEEQITDQSSCVCVTIRPIAIWLNDFMKTDERQQLLPFILRAMGTATDDENVIQARLVEVVRFSNDMAAFATQFASSVRTAELAAEIAKYAALSAAKHAANCACATAKLASKYSINRQQLVERGIAFLDAVCPPLTTPTEVVVNRMNKLVEISNA